MSAEDEVFRTGNKERIWQKYCGFLDLSLSDFIEMQEQLLVDQIELVYGSPLAKKFMPRKPKSVSEFRKLVPLTTYKDYAADFGEKNEEVLAIKPCCWVRTSGRGGIAKQIPYTETALESFARVSVAVMILSCADRKGEVNFGRGLRVLHNVPPAPYSSAVVVHLVSQMLDATAIPPFDKYENVDFETRMLAGFQIAMRTGVDVLSSLTSVLVKMGAGFTESSKQMKFNRDMMHPQMMWRLLMAWLRCKREHRNLLPKDLWPLKGLLCYGTDTSIYREQLMRYWGKEPFEFYGSTEAGPMATQVWNKKTLTFAPSSSFIELVPEEEWLKGREKARYQPSTVLLDEVKPGERYEVIITNFYGMPLLRYRMGDLIRIVALEDRKAGIKLPQMVFESRADDLIDIAGFAKLDEKTIWQAIVDTGIRYEDWSARKEYEQNEPILRLYIELKESNETKEVARLIHQKLLEINQDYKDSESMLGIRPLRVTILPFGSFQRYYERKKASGAELAHLKPPHMNAPDTAILDLLSRDNNNR